MSGGRRRAAQLLAVPAMVGIGALAAVQATVNGALARELGTGMRAGVAAASLSFGSGLAILLAVCLASPRLRPGVQRVYAALRRGPLRPWHGAGGAAGALLVAAQGLTVQTIGVALFTVAVVAGQTSSALAVDHAGVGPSGRRVVTPGRGLGAAVTLAAAVVVVVGRRGGSEPLTGAVLALAILPLVAGAASSWQQAVNGRVAVVGGPLPTALNNFVVGTGTLLVVLLASLAAPGTWSGLVPAPWWLYSGGVIGCVFIAAAAVLVRVHGVLVLGLCTIAGQVVMSLMLDATTGVRLTATTVAGAVVALLGVGIVAWASAPRSATAGRG